MYYTTTDATKFNKDKSIILKLYTAFKSHLSIAGRHQHTPHFYSLLAALTLGSSLPMVVSAEAIGPLTPEQRALEAYNLRLQAADQNYSEPLPAHPHNNDETLYPEHINSYTKGLPHDENGIVDSDAYKSLIKALKSGDPGDFDAIQSADEAVLGLRNPQAAYTYFMEGKDSHSYTMPAAPAFDSAWQASDAIEVLWQAITRDVPFIDYDTDPLIKAAAKDLTHMKDYRGPTKNGNLVTPQTLFRGIGVGETVGPYISQFLLQPIPYGATTVEQKYKVPTANVNNNYLTKYENWLLIQRGGKLSGDAAAKEYETEGRYIYSGRAMAEFVLKDFVYQAYLGATRIIRGYGAEAYDPNDPYKGKTAEARSPLFGNNHALDYIGRVAMGSQNVAWYQKWLVHRRARPEVFFGRVHNHLTKPDIEYPIHPDVLKSPALDIVFDMNAATKGGPGTYLLPVAGDAGSPLHPTYPAGHAVMAGAAVTMLKAFFNGDFVIPNPVIPNEDGTELVPYNGPELTIESELNKLGSNISLGRDVAGVHYRTDGDLGMAVGEEYAISLLRELVKTYNEDFAGFTFNKFDGTPVLVSKEGVFFN
jgi:hypothetical protein